MSSYFARFSNIKNALNETPIYCVAQTDYIDIAELLIKNGAEINSKAFMGGTPLTAATLTGHFNMAKLLRKYGAR